MRYKLSDSINEQFYKLPKGLFLFPKYRNLSANAKIVYSILLDRLKISQINRWVDANGDVYLIYGQEKLADVLALSRSVVSRTMKSLSDAGLIECFKHGFSSACRIYIHKLEIPEQEQILPDASEEGIVSVDAMNEIFGNNPSENDIPCDPVLLDTPFSETVDSDSEQHMCESAPMDVHQRTTIGANMQLDKTQQNQHLCESAQMDVHQRTTIGANMQHHLCKSATPFVQIRNSNCANLHTNKTEYNKTECNKTECNKTEFAPSAGAELEKNSEFVKRLFLALYYNRSNSVPSSVFDDIDFVVRTYPLDLIKKAVEEAKRCHAYGSSYVLGILAGWKEKMDAGIEKPWEKVLTKRRDIQRSRADVVLSGVYDDDDDAAWEAWEKNQKFPWREASNG